MIIRLFKKSEKRDLSEARDDESENLWPHDRHREVGSRLIHSLLGADTGGIGWLETAEIRYDQAG